MATTTVWERLGRMAVMVSEPGKFSREEIRGLAASLVPQVRELKTRVATSGDRVLEVGLGRLETLLADIARGRPLATDQMTQTESYCDLPKCILAVHLIFPYWEGRHEQFGCERADAQGICAACNH